MRIMRSDDMKKNRTLLWLSSFFLGCGVTLGATLMLTRTNPSNAGIVSPDAYGEITSIDQVYEALRSSHYFYEGDDQALIDGAISGMIQALNDPHSSYFTAKDYEMFVEHLEDTYSGIGCEVTSINGYTIIVSPFPDAPADLAGILPNDVVIEVDGENVVGLHVQEVTNKIKGKKGSTVTLGIQRQENPELIEIEVVRDDINQETVTSEMLSQSGQAIGYIQVSTFGESTAADFEAAVEALEAQGATSIIVDLRNNSGGYLTSVVQMVDYLLPEGQVITTIADRDNSGQQYITSGKGKDLEIITLINEGSASASEIFAAAMKEAGNFEVVGQTSFGKGTVQVTIPIDTASSLKLTTQVWRTPEDNWINEVGVEPTIEVKAPDFYSYYQVYLPEGEPLAFDMVNASVANAQKILTTLGYETDRQDGYFSKQTVEAVKQYQAQHDLEVNGNIDSATATKLTMSLRDRVKDKQYDTQLKKALQQVTK